MNKSALKLLALSTPCFKSVLTSQSPGVTSKTSKLF